MAWTSPLHGASSATRRPSSQTMTSGSPPGDGGYERRGGRVMGDVRLRRPGTGRSVLVEASQRGDLDSPGPVRLPLAARSRTPHGARLVVNGPGREAPAT